MKRRLWILPLLGLCLVAGRVHAQGYYAPPTSPFGRPAVSPYINLANGINPAISYYGLVRPQLNTYSNIQQLQLQSAALQQQVTTGTQVTGPVITGVPSRFMTQSRYFMTQYTSPVVAGRAGFGTALPRRPGVGAPPGSSMVGTAAPATSPLGGTSSLTPALPGPGLPPGAR
jgi:hypothetical protein